MPRQLQRISLIAAGHQREVCIADKGTSEIDQLAIDPSGQRGLGQPRANRHGYIRGGGTGRHFAHGTIGQADLELV